MKAEFKDGHFTACYGGNTIYEKSTLQAMKKADLIELIECAQHNYEIMLEDNDTRNPDTYINANDVLIIDRIGEEKE